MKSKMSRDRKRLAAEGWPTRGGVVIAWISPGQTSHYFTESLFATGLVGLSEGWLVNSLPDWSSANVSASRNTVTARFLDSTDAEWLLWVDSDMRWDPSKDIQALLDAADPVERPIVGGLCFGMATDGMFPTIYHFTRVDGRVVTARVREYPRDEVFSVAATGAAFLLIHRRVLVEMRDAGFNATFPWFQETELDGNPVGEDLTFCIRAAGLGIPIHVHTGVRIGHHKSRLLTEEEFDKEWLPAGLPPGVGLVIPTRGDHPELLRAIVATSGLPPERVVVVVNGDGPLPDVDLPATKIYDPGPINIHRWWNVGIDLLAERGCTRVAVLNDDLIIAPDTLPKMARALGSATLAVLDDPYGVSGHCWLLNITHGVRPDESYRWWCGDLQLWADAQRAGGVVTVPDAWCLHMHANEATWASPDLAALADADGILYDSRHPAGTPFARDPDRARPPVPTGAPA